MSEPERTPLLDFGLLLAQHRRLLIAVPALVALAAFGVTFLLAPSYTAVSRAFVDVAAGPNMNAQAEQYVSLLKSRTVLDSVIKRYDLAAVYGADTLDEARKELESRTKISRSQTILSIEADDHDPRRAADIANAFVGELAGLVQALAFTPASQRRLFFEGQLAHVSKRLAAAQAELRAAGASEATIRKLSQSRDDAVARLNAQLAFQEMRLAATYGQTHAQPNSVFEYRLVIQEIASLGAELAKLQQAGAKPGAALGAHGPAYRDFKTYQLLHEMVEDQHKLAKADEDRIVQFVEKAVAPMRQSKPRRVLIAAEAGLIALALVLCAVLLRRVAAGHRPSPATHSG